MRAFRSKRTDGEAAIEVASSNTKRIAQLSKESVETACAILDGFIGPSHVAARIRCGQGDAKDYFFGELIELAATVEAIPQIYKQEGKGDGAITHLHYFTNGGSD